MKIDLTNQRILVTGATRGIGLAIARRLLDAGATLGAHYHKSQDVAESLVDGQGGSAAFGADLSDPVAAAELVRAVADRLGGLDTVVLNAAVAIEAPVDLALTEWIERFNRTVATNLTSVAVMCREAIPNFRRDGGGRFIHVASRAAFRGDTPDYLAYAASKGGMVALSRSLARGFGKDGIKSFVVAPGFTRTEMAQDFIDKYGEDVAMKDVVLDRLTEPDDIAPWVVLLASGLGDHATGCSIDINAGSYVR